ncbi:MAG TPA: hypothetical protein VGH77_13935 [Streptosporangiaceae bacterium]
MASTVPQDGGRLAGGRGPPLCFCAELPGCSAVAKPAGGSGSRSWWSSPATLCPASLCSAASALASHVLH